MMKGFILCVFCSSLSVCNAKPHLRPQRIQPHSLISAQQSSILGTVSSILTLTLPTLLLNPRDATATALQSIGGRISEIPANEDLRKSSIKVSDSSVLASAESIALAAQFIKEHCSQTLSAVKQTGRCLYRGEKSVENRAVLLTPEPALLNPDTYSSSAVDYFKSIDTLLIESGVKDVRPSIGHIGTSNAMKAGEWGPVCSIWPLNGLHYAVFNSGESEWWDEEWGTPQGVRGPFFWRDKKKLDQFLTTEVSLTVDQGLEDALRSGREVLFCSSSPNKSDDNSLLRGILAMSPSTSGVKGIGTASLQERVRKGRANLYLAVPVSFEGKLLELLDIQPFSPTVKITQQPQMEADDIKRKRVYVSDKPPVKKLDFIENLKRGEKTGKKYNNQ